MKETKISPTDKSFKKVAKKFISELKDPEIQHVVIWRGKKSFSPAELAKEIELETEIGNDYVYSYLGAKQKIKNL